MHRYIITVTKHGKPYFTIKVEQIYTHEIMALAEDIKTRFDDAAFKVRLTRYDIPQGTNLAIGE